MSMAHDPFPNAWMAKVIRGISWIRPLLSKANAKASRTAQPAIFMSSYQRTAFNVATSAVDNISSTN